MFCCVIAWKIEVTHDPIKNCNSCKKSVRHRNSVYQRIEWLWRIHPIHNAQQNFVAACSEPRTEFPSELYLILKVRGGQFLYNPFSFTGNIFLKKLVSWSLVQPFREKWKSDCLIDKGGASTGLFKVHTPTRRGLFDPCVYVFPPLRNWDLSLDVQTP